MQLPSFIENTLKSNPPLPQVDPCPVAGGNRRRWHARHGPRHAHAWQGIGCARSTQRWPWSHRGRKGLFDTSPATLEAPNIQVRHTQNSAANIFVRLFDRFQVFKKSALIGHNSAAHVGMEI